LFPYIKTYEAEQFSFIKVPKLLVTDKMFENLSASAKFLYGLMLDRVCLSLQNGWIDDNGNVYIYFTLNEVRQNLGCGADKAVALLAELDGKKGIGLIERKKQGQGRPTIIYVKNFVTAAPGQTVDKPKSEQIQTSEKPMSETAQTTENQKSRLRFSRSQDFGKSDTNKTDSIKTDFSQTDSSIHQPDGCDGWSGSQSEKQSAPDLSDIERLKEEVSGQVYLHSFLDERGQDGQPTYKPGLVRAVFSVIIELLIHTGDSIFIDGGSVNTEYVKNQVRAMRPADFEYVLKGLQNNTNPVRNMKAYIRTAVYRAVSMSDAHYDYDENKTNGFREVRLDADAPSSGI